MKANQKGFSVVEILVVIVIVGLIGAVGWLVYDRQKSKTSETSNTQVNTQQKEETPKQETKTVDLYEGWQSFNNSKLKFTFQYPSDWKADVFDENGLFSVTLIAPGTTTGGEAYEEITKGAKIYINCPNTAYTSLDQFKKESSIYTGSSTDKHRVAVNGADAEQYVVGHEGPEKRITTFFVGKQMCDVAIQESVYEKAEFAKVYDQLVSSIKF